MAQAAQPWENVYVFISSTFNDMHAERDYLVKRVFPELAAWCEERRLRLVDIDLRWGVTEADSRENKRVVDVCLSNIDRCRPLFLCFLGQRRGWVPGADDIAAATFEGFPGLREHLGASVTEMEVLHALIDPMVNGSVMELANRERAFFFLRDPGYLDAIADQHVRDVYTNEAEPDPAWTDAKLAAFKERVRATGRPVAGYTAAWDPAASTPELLAPGKPEGIDKGRLTGFECGGRELSDVVVGQLKGAISELYPGRAPAPAGTPLQRELDEQARFQQLASEGFIERAGDFDGLYAYLEGDVDRPCAICAQAGFGKTSFIAQLVQKLRADENYEVLYRFVGTGEGSVSVASLLASIGEELSSRFGLANVPTEAQKLRESLPSMLAKAAEKAGKRLVVLVDAVNQLDAGLEDLTWIPAFLAGDVRFIYSFKLGEPAADKLHDELIMQEGMTVLELKGFEGRSDREALVDQYLSRYLKELDDDKVEAIVSSDGAGNPLFLKVLLSELRVFGSHEGLRDLIANQFGTTPQQAFEGVLRRLESDSLYSQIPPQALVSNIFGWLAHAKNGLEPRELAELLVENGHTASIGEATDAVNLVLRQLRPYLAKRDKRQDFFYESFLLAAHGRYDGRASWHKQLADYFAKRAIDDPRRLQELAYQYAHAGMANELRALLTSYAFMEARLRVTGVQGLVSDYILADLPQAGLGADDRFQFALVREALEMATGVLARDATQLPVQLHARLLGFDAPLVSGILDDADRFMKEHGIPWLKPLCACLPQPGGRILRNYKTGKSCNAQLFNDRKHMLVCLDGERAVKAIEIATGRVVRAYPFEFTPEQLLLIEEDNAFAICSASAMLIVDLMTGESRVASGVKRAGLWIKGAGCGMLVSRCDSRVYVTKIATGELLHEFESHDLNPRWEGYNGFSLAFDQETGQIFLTIEERGITVFDREDGFRPVRRYCYFDGTLKGWAAERMKFNSGPKFTWTYVPAGTPYVVALTKYDGVTVYDKRSGEALLNEMEYRIDKVRTALSMERGLFALSSGNRLSLYVLGSFEQAVPPLKLRDSNWFISCLEFTPDGACLFVGWNDGLVEILDTSTWEAIDSYAGVGSMVCDIWQDVPGVGLAARCDNGQVVVWKRQKGPEAPEGAADCLQEHGWVHIAPDDSFLLAAVHGHIQRIDIPSMAHRDLMKYEFRKNLEISRDSKHFMMEQKDRKHVIEFFDCADGAVVGEMEVIDTTGTGHPRATESKTRNYQFLPEELSLGPRNLTVIYRQWGEFVMQDPDAPEKTKVVHAFPGSTLDMMLFDGGTKVALQSDDKRFDPDAGPDKHFETKDPALSQGKTKVYDLRTCECIERFEASSDWKEVCIRALDLDAYPVAEALARGPQFRDLSYSELCRAQGRLLYCLKGDGASDMRHIVVRDSQLKEPLCWYTGDGQAPTWIKARCTSDGKYLFLMGNTFFPFSIENVFNVEAQPTTDSPFDAFPDHSAEMLAHLGLVLSGKDDIGNLADAFRTYAELVERYPRKDLHRKNQAAVARKIIAKLDTPSEDEDAEAVERWRPVLEGAKSYLSTYREEPEPSVEEIDEANRVHSGFVERFADEHPYYRTLKICGVFRELCDSDDVATLERYFKAYRAMARQHLGDVTYERLRDEAQEQLALALAHRDDPASKERAAELNEELLERGYNVATSTVRLRNTRADAAELYRLEGKEQGNLESAQKAYTLYGLLAERFPDRPHYRKNQNVTEHNLAYLLLKKGLEGDIGCLRASRERYRNILKREPENAGVLKNMEVLEKKLAFLLSKESDVESLRESRGLYAMLAARHPDEPLWEKNLGIVTRQLDKLA